MIVTLLHSTMWYVVHAEVRDGVITGRHEPVLLLGDLLVKWEDAASSLLSDPAATLGVVNSTGSTLIGRTGHKGPRITSDWYRHEVNQ